jgi:hypothetical protein
MSRKSLSVVLLVVIVLALGACRRQQSVTDLSTPTANPYPGATTSPTASPAATTSATLTATATPTATAPAATSTVPAATATGATAPPTPAPTATPTPDFGPPPGSAARITFAPGATSATVRSNLAAGGDTDNWLLRVRAGQVVTVHTVSSAPGAIMVSLLDSSGGALATNPDTVGISAAVPVDGDYQLVFSTSNAAGQVAYTAQVFIPAAAGPVTPTRISFAPGSSSAQLDDSLSANGDLNSYVLTVGAGQGINVAVFASVPAVTNIYIRNSAGQLVSTGTDMSGLTATVAASGDYYIDVSSAATAPALTYRLTVTVPPITQPQPPVRLTFAPGATSTQRDDTLTAGGDTNNYVLYVTAGQTINVAVFASVPAITNISIRNSAGQTIGSGSDMSGASASAATAGDYFIDVSSLSGSPAVNYRLTVTVPPVPQPPPQQPTRITFAPGAISAQLDDALAAGGDLNSYVVSVGTGQNLSVAVFASVPAVSNIYIRNTAGQLIASGADMTGVSVTVPAAGDYFIDVSSPSAAPALTHRLTVTIPPISPEPPEPVRIAFPAGATSAIVEGQVVAGGAGARYVLFVQEGQTLITNLSDNPPGNVDIVVEDAEGHILNVGRAPTELGSFPPESGDYFITLSTHSATPVTYSLEVTVPPLPQDNATRITFAPGADSAEVTGSLDFASDLDFWVVQAQAGQTLQVDIGPSEPGWLDVYIYNEAGDILAIGDDSATTFASLATNGDYFIVVNTTFGAPPVTYTMTVRIP